VSRDQRHQITWVGGALHLFSTQAAQEPTGRHRLLEQRLRRLNDRLATGALHHRAVIEGAAESHQRYALVTGDCRSSRSRPAGPRGAGAVEDIDFRHPRGLDRSQVLSLATAQWATGHHNILIVGPTGCGKSFLACAMAQAAIRAGRTALYQRVPRLLFDLALARLDGRWPRLLLTLAGVDVLVLDDLALRPLTTDQAADLLEVIEDRHL